MSVSLGKQGRRSWKETRETVVTASLWCGFVTFSFGMIGESVYPVKGCQLLLPMCCAGCGRLAGVIWRCTGNSGDDEAQGWFAIE